ncbi:MAG: 6-phosphofructokinase [Xylanivirga thermophila]|uniref:6-phosphofructokinase n=1 Tax=Xylanivirga thermophila TaxID=2496273 RepID=UPI00101DEDF4|nr:6-phosphofructokinase [Xylanivirga thermophila]
MKTIGVLTSGGDAPGMNAAIRAVVRTAIFNNMKVLGVKRGYNGLIHGEIDEMDVASVGDIVHRGGTILRTARCQEFKTPEGQKMALDMINHFGIEGMVVIGGDGSFRGAQVLSRMGVPSVAIPGTIDNDIACSDFSIGFDTAVNTVLDAINKIRDTITSHGRANIIQVMGRNAGDIALYAGVGGGAENIIVPEIPFDVDDICNRLLEGKKRGKLSQIIVLAEGVGNASEFAKIIEAKTGIEIRETILGHIQRGGNPTSFDRILASRMGAHAVGLLRDGIGNRVVCIRNNSIIDEDIEKALSMTKEFDKELYALSKVLSI